MPEMSFIPGRRSKKLFKNIEEVVDIIENDEAIYASHSVKKVLSTPRNIYNMHEDAAKRITSL